MAASGTRIELCGGLAVEVEGRRRDGALHGRQGRLALGYLVLHRAHPVRRDELIEALWPADGPAPSETALAPVLSRLRRAIEPAVIEGRGSYQLTLPEPVWIDLEVATANVTAAARRLAEGAPDDALALAHEALSLTGGGLLPRHEADWLDEQRVALGDLRVEALELAARAGSWVGGAAFPRAETDARAAVAAAPYRESARAVLMDVLAARGNVAEALRAYEEIRALLREELGTVPGSDLVKRHARLLRDDTAAGQSRPAAGPPPAPSLAGLVERHAELRRIEAALERLGAGAGGVLLVEGAAGLGKTRLLAELVNRARGAGALVLTARASLLEREFGFGLVRQLFANVAAAEHVTSAAARSALTGTGEGEGIFPVLEGLHQLVTGLARNRVVALCADDLQWADSASLRFLAYLARRIAAHPVLIAGTVRSGEPDVAEALLSELLQDPEAVVLGPQALSAAGTAELVRQRLGEPDDPFVAACQEVTAGNPLLVSQLVGGLADESIVPDAAHAPAVRDIGPRAVSRTVRLRLARMPALTVAVARAAAVLGEQPGIGALAALAETSEREAAQAVRALARAEILRAEEPLGFVHPLVRDAVYHELPASARGLEHARAARLLADLGASPERVAAQLLLAPPAGDPWVVGQLRDAADVAMRRGAPDAALTLLERAQAEPPPPDLRASLTLELGGSAAYLRGPAGVEPLRRAYAALTDAIERGEAAIRLSHLLLFVSSPQEGVALAQRAAQELGDQAPDLRDALLAVRLIGVAFGAVDPSEFETLEAVRRGPRGDGPGARSLTAMTAFATALVGGPAAEASLLAREAFAGDGLERFELTAPVALASAVLTLGDPAEGLLAIERYAAHARRRGEILGSIGADLWGGFAHILAGDLPAAIRSLDRAHEGERLWGTKLDAVMAYSAAFLAHAWLEQGDLERAREMLARVDAAHGSSDGARFWQTVQAEILLAAGEPEQTVAITRRLEPMRPLDTHPVWAPWRGLRARALHRLGHADEALALAGEELEIARRVAAPWVVGRTLRLLAELEGPDGVEHAREAVQLLGHSSARLELAKALAVLGETLIAWGRHAEALGALSSALDLARECAAHPLAARAEQAAEPLRRAAPDLSGRG